MKHQSITTRGQEQCRMVTEADFDWTDPSHTLVATYDHESDISEAWQEVSGHEDETATALFRASECYDERDRAYWEMELVGLEVDGVRISREAAMKIFGARRLYHFEEIAAEEYSA